MNIEYVYHVPVRYIADTVVKVVMPVEDVDAAIEKVSKMTDIGNQVFYNPGKVRVIPKSTENIHVEERWA